MNFINQSVSQLLGRTKEVGIRKVLGGKYGQLINQFMIEGLIISTISILTGVLIIYFLLPTINNYFDFDIHSNVLEHQEMVYFLVAMGVFTVLICSLWPSIALSRLRPANSIKGVIPDKKPGGFFRNALIVLQFSSSIFLIVGTIVIWNQIQNETLVKGVTLAECIPGAYHENYNTFEFIDSMESKSVHLRQTTIDYYFFETFKIKIVNGRNFSRPLESDRDAVIINETAMKEFGWSAVDGKEICPGGGEPPLKVIGVVEDYYYQLLKRTIQPVIYFYDPECTTRMAIRLDPELSHPSAGSDFLGYKQVGYCV